MTDEPANQRVVYRNFHFVARKGNVEFPFDVTQIVKTTWDYSTPPMKETVVGEAEFQILDDLVNEEQCDDVEQVAREVFHKFQQLGWTVEMNE